jgi:hypothetical protein
MESGRDIKTIARVLRDHFVYFMCLRFLGRNWTPIVGGWGHHAAARFLFADGYAIFAFRLDGKN